MTTTEIGLLAGVVLQLFTLLALIVGVARRIATKDDIKRLDARIDQTNADMKAGFLRIDERFEAQRIEFKADLQRVEDRTAQANVFHARSVELLDAIRRELEDRRERL